ncbi:uncharacterized protein LOC135829128 [Sycon ciliatum]|uniref:uncharacterized protein LOC135829128 n=1 Tax=Sycon ciliatum TaxID=27933 RepID=UPI0031F6D186
MARNGHAMQLLVRHYREKAGHSSGVKETMTQLQERFWVIAAREVIPATKVEAACNYCKRKKARPAKQVMAPLPKSLLSEPLEAFARTSVDYAGPFETKQGRGQRRAKQYLCLFTCMTSRAVHLEMATSLSTDCFLNAFERFCSRRGVPTHVRSDNGTNFVGAQRELQELINQFDEEKIAQKAANNSIHWSFNPPLAPHFGGVHEAMVKSAK